MIQEYRGFIIDGRKDFKIKEIDERYTLFQFDPAFFPITEEQAQAFQDSLPSNIRAVVTIDTSEAPMGIITMRIHSGIVHYYASELIKDRITVFIFDCRIQNTDTANNPST